MMNTRTRRKTHNRRTNQNTNTNIPPVRFSKRLRNKQLKKSQNNSSSNNSYFTYNPSPIPTAKHSRNISFNHRRNLNKKRTILKKEEESNDDTFSNYKEYKRISLSSPNKRRLSDESKKNGTPPPKKRTMKTYESPSKTLAKAVSHLSMKKHRQSYIKDYTSDEKTEEHKNVSRKLSFGNYTNYQSRTQNIQKVQQQLLTQDMTNQQLKGRETEYSTILSFLTSNLKQKQGNSLYICGSPGTGKTATILQIEQYLWQHKQSLNIANIIKLNAMRFHKPQEIYTTLYNNIKNNTQHISAFSAIKELDIILFSQKRNDKNKKMYVVIIDECDGLLIKQQTILNRLFLWCKKSNSKLILIGIANTVDLTDRFLPRLRTRNCEPQLLIFKPYTKEQLINILKYRLLLCTNNESSNVENIPYFESIALELCAQKVAKMYGDLRKCLEICRSALYILVDDRNKSKIGFLDMKQILDDSFSSPVIDVIRELPNHQKILIVIASILYSECRWMTDRNLLMFYNYVVCKYSLPKCSSNDYVIVIESLVADGILKIIYEYQNGGRRVGGKKKYKKLQTCVPLKDVQFAVEDSKVLSKLFDVEFQIPARFLN